jgi:peptidoglycan/xylan/chitin deacetylase (PgdA/CDA1 family)
MFLKLLILLIRKSMRKILVLHLLLFILLPAFPQDAKEYSNVIFLNKLNKNSSYLDLKKKVLSEFAQSKPGLWGEDVPGVIKKLSGQQKYIALTFDACGGKNGNGVDIELIDFLRKEKIPATLFISGKWIDANFTAFIDLSRDTLFEIENHGLAHRPCSIDGKSIYGIKGTLNIAEAFDEIEANARKIEAITKHRPLFYRSSTAYIDEVCVKMANRIGIKVIGFQVLAGDAISSAPVSVIESNVLNKIKPGAIVLMHFNHPEGNTFEAMQRIVPKLREQGYTFVRLKP